MFSDNLIDFMFTLKWINFILHCSGLKSMQSHPKDGNFQAAVN